MESWVVILIMLIIAVAIGVLVAISRISSLRHNKKYERGLKMIPLLIHLPPTTDDIDANGRDKRDIMNEAISKAGVMYSILASTITKGLKHRLYGEQHFSFEIIAHGGFIRLCHDTRAPQGNSKASHSGCLSDRTRRRKTRGQYL